MTPPRRAGRDQQWLFALLPAFPLVLLVLRLFSLSRQDLPTMLLLAQSVNPLGPISALLITLMWALPLIILIGRALGALLWVSAPREEDAVRSWLVRTSLRMPHWVVVLSVALAALTWQLRFLPTLLMTALAILGLTVRGRRTASSRRVRAVCVALPLAVAAAAYAWLGPAIGAAAAEGELVTTALLLLPPGLAVLLTGPIPGPAARPVTHSTAVVAALLAPFLVGTVFLRAPILPTVAMEIAPDPRDSSLPAVVLGHEIAVDDRMTTVLDPRGAVRFVPNDRLVSKALCPEPDQVPFSAVTVYGWPVELTSLEWLAGGRAPAEADPRCQGRPLTR